MITIIIFGVIGLIIVMILVSDGFKYFDFFFPFSVVFGAFIGAFIGGIIAYILPAKTEIVKATYRLEALQDNNSINGSFFLGSGQIGGRMKYVFYYEKDGYYELEQVDYNKAKVKYSDEKPKVERLTRENVRGAFINNFAIDFNCYEEYIIYVPKGTINNNYSLDAQ